MPHKRHYHSKRKFKDGVYQLLSSERTREMALVTVQVYRNEGGPKIRFIRGSDGRYHIYEKVE